MKRGCLLFLFVASFLSPRFVSPVTARTIPPLTEILAACEYLAEGEVPEDTSTAAGKTSIYVAVDGDDGNSGLAVDTPKRHLGAAIAYANAHPGTPAVIYLRDGTYYRQNQYEYQRIERGNLMIAAYPGETVVIRPDFWPNNPVDWGEEHLFVSSGPYENITISSLTLEGWGEPFFFGSDFEEEPMRGLVIKNIEAREFRTRGPQFISVFFSTDYVPEGYLPGPDDFDPLDPGVKYQIEGLILSRIDIADADIAVNIGDEDDANVKGIRISQVEVRNDPQPGEGSFKDGFALVNCSKALIDNCVIENAGDDGIDTKSFDVSVVNTLVKGAYRNAVKFWRNGELINSIICDCTPIDDGALIIGEGPGRMVHSILMKKSAGYCGTYNYGGSTVEKFEIINSVFADLDHTFYLGTSGLSSRNSLYYDLPGGLFSGQTDLGTVAALNSLPGSSGNISADPLFRSPIGDDFTPRIGSPCIDGGTETGTDLPDFDYYGNPRSRGRGPDIGPVEAAPPVVPESGDYDGDGTSEIAVFQDTSGLWAVRGMTRLYFGTGSDLPAAGDYDGDGTTDIGIFRPASGLWAVRGLSRFYFGDTSGQPVSGDYDGDGSCEAALFRPAPLHGGTGSGLWEARDLTRLYFGLSGDWPVPGDYDGDGTRDFAVYRPTAGLWAVRDVSRIYFGRKGDWPVPGDYDGDGAWEAAIFRPASGLWALRNVTRSYYGAPSDLPVPADYDGNGGDNPAVFRPSSGLWGARGLTRVYFGTGGAIPVTR